MRWLELASRIDSEAAEAVSEVFSRVAAGGIAIEPDLIPGADDGYQLGPNATVRGYIPIDESASSKTHQIEEALWHLRAIWPVGELETREVAEEDWASAWKAHYHTFRVGKRIVIRPSWLDDQPKDDDVLVSLDPGAAFGTGLHPTTRRCLELLEDVIRPGDNVFDVGTGSGILAIAAIGLGARHVLAVDVDPVAVTTARENVAVNGLSTQVTVDEGSVDHPASAQKYNLVVANIIARVILELAPRLVGRLQPGGSLIVGGVIADRAGEVEQALTRLGLTVRVVQDNDWFTFAGRLGGA
ncbi:MAG TPA: 50S ribosomal protein L11 methyltransferase [Chloroflexota bacterium]|nr:50S ribosomal protein L11 methyltransferase [Chloroflexota bacterium]